jgi:hypothetical protein
MLCALMGAGCEEVLGVSTPDSDVIVSRWINGKVIRTNTDVKTRFGHLLKQVASFIQTGNPPVPK